MPHIPVLLNETIKILDPKPGKFFIDGTIGSGGHSAAILEKISPGGILLGIDWDKTAIETLQEKIAANSKFSAKGGSPPKADAPLEHASGGKTQNSKLILVPGDYADLPEILKQNNLPKADGLILDLGFSSEQLEKSGRGFSFLKDEPLDMRYQFQEVRPPEIKRKYLGGRTSQILTAAEIINTFSEKELADIIYKYGEERYSRRIARKIIEERRKKPIKTTFELVNIVNRAVPGRGRLNPATKTFQALRIYVNQELQNLEKLLKNLGKIVKPGGRTTIISFHSLEDRLVKNYFGDMGRQGKAEILTRKPLIPTREEMEQNPRARSAKLRAAIL